MGWNSSAIWIEDRTREDLLGLLPDIFSFTPTGRMVSFDEATTSRFAPNLAVARVGNWQALWNPDMRFVERIEVLLEDRYAARIASGTRVLAILFSSVTSTYAFWLFEDARLVRAAVFETGEATRDEGEPLPCEADAPVPSWGHDEGYLFHLVDNLTGQSFVEMEAASWEVVTWS